MSELRQALEQSLVDNPNDLAAHSAYADLLSEEGDPRGEFIQVQLALERSDLSAGERQRLQQREAGLLAQHGDIWCGSLAAFTVDPYLPTRLWNATFARGWLDELRIDLLHADLARALAADPSTRLLRRLAIADVFTPYNLYRYGLEDTQAAGSEDEGDALQVLTHSPYLGNVRAFYLGSHEGFVEDQSDAYMYNSREDLYRAGLEVWEFIKRMPHLEELYLFVNAQSVERLFASRELTGLRILQLYLAEHYPLDVLAENAALGRLTHLSLHPQGLEGNHDTPLISRNGVRALLDSPHLGNLTHLRLHQAEIGDAGCAKIVSSGVLRRLKFLDLARGNITDDGACLLTLCPDLRHLDVLDVSFNALTREGIAALERTGITVRADAQHAFDDNEYLYEGEME